MEEALSELIETIHRICEDKIDGVGTFGERVERQGKAVERFKSRIKNLTIDTVIERFSGENLQKLQNHFVELYGSDEMAQEKANSFAVGFGKACELIIKDLKVL